MVKFCIIVSIIAITLYILVSILEHIAVKKGKMKKQDDPLKKIVKEVSDNDRGTSTSTTYYDSSK